jgi:hypothetical protein
VRDHDEAVRHARAWGFLAVWSGASLLDLERERTSLLDAEAEASADGGAAFVARVLESLPRGA